MIGIGKNKKKQGVDKDKQSDAKSSSNPVLNALKRFRVRHETPEPEDQFLNRLGDVSPEMSETISTIESRIDANKDQEASSTETVRPKKTDTVDMTTGSEPVPSDDTQTDPETSEAISTERSAQRTSTMQFHKPAYSPPKPETAIDPDFSGSTQPPDIHNHKAHEGVMANTGTKNYKKPTKEKVDEGPLDRGTFADHIRARIKETSEVKPQGPGSVEQGDAEPNPAEPDPSVENMGEANPENDKPTAARPEMDSEMADEAKAFATNFYKRVSQVQTQDSTPKRSVPVDKDEDAASDKSNPAEPTLKRSPAAPRVKPSPPPLIPLRRRAAYPTPSDNQQSGFGEQTPHNPLRKTATPSRANKFVPAEPRSLNRQEENVRAQTPDVASGPLPSEPNFLRQDRDKLPLRDPLTPTSPDTQDNSQTIGDQTDAPPAAPQTFNEPEQVESDVVAHHAEDVFHDTPPSSQATDPVPEQHNQVPQLNEASPDEQSDPDVFAKPDIDEDALLVRIYDLVQSELNRAWGENITINIRQIVRDEIRAELDKKRSE